MSILLILNENKQIDKKLSIRTDGLDNMENYY